jgi:hypothetical protein
MLFFARLIFLIFSFQLAVASPLASISELIEDAKTERDYFFQYGSKGYDKNRCPQPRSHTHQQICALKSKILDSPLSEINTSFKDLFLKNKTHIRSLRQLLALFNPFSLQNQIKEIKPKSGSFIFSDLPILQIAQIPSIHPITPQAPPKLVVS